MPARFPGLLILSLIGFICSWSGDLVLGTTILTFGLMLPVWYVAANLWWVLLALMPALVLRGRGKASLGLGIGVAAVAAFWVVATAFVSQSRAALTVAAPLPEPGLARLAGTPGSVDLPLGVGEDACGRVCQVLLTGPEMRWLRVRTSDTGGVVVFQRADVAECQALDPGFPADAPCILARPDDGATADLRIEITSDGDFFGPMQDNPGWVYLTGIQRLRLIDDRVQPPRVLDERLRYGWSEPVIGPLVPGMTALGSGARNDGPGFARRRLQSDPVDLAAVLSHAGVALGPVEPAVDPASLHSVALLASILQTSGDGTLAPGQSAMAQAFVERARAALSGRSEQPFGPVERTVLRQLADLRGDLDLERSLRSMMGEYPEAFYEDFGALLRVVVTGTPHEAARAADAAGFGLYKSKRGDHDAAWPDYVAAIETGRSEDLIRWIGRFNRDPLPVLRAQMQRVPTGKTAWNTLSAVCHIDQRWWDTLVPFYYDTALGYLPKTGDSDWNGMEIHYALRALAFLGRRDLAEDLLARIDWSLVQEMPDWADSPGSAERFRESLQNGLEAPLRC